MLKEQDMDFIWNPTFEGLDSEYRAHDGIYSHLTHKYYLAPCDIGIGGADILSNFDYNDSMIGLGAYFWVKLVEDRLGCKIITD